MTRFQASGPRIAYTPKQGTKPFEQMIGLYNMWQALPPHVRNWFGSLFKSDGEMGIVGDELDPNLDTSLTHTGIPDWNSENARKAQVETLVGAPIDWDSVGVEIPDYDYKYPDVGIIAGPGSDTSTEPSKSKQSKAKVPDVDWSSMISVNPGEFKEAVVDTADLPTGHWSWAPWRKM